MGNKVKEEGIIIKGVLDKKNATICACLFGSMYAILGIALGVIFSILELLEIAFCIGLIIGGVILGIIVGACMYFGLHLVVSTLIATDKQISTGEATLSRGAILAIDRTRFSGIRIRLNGATRRYYRVNCLKNRDEIINILVGKPVSIPVSAPAPIPPSEPAPVAEPEPTLELDPMLTYGDYKVAVEDEQLIESITNINESEKDVEQLLAQILVKIADLKQQDEKQAKQLLVQTLAKMADVKGKSEKEAEQKLVQALAKIAELKQENKSE